MMAYNKKKANIIEIERFAIHDGPGIRSVIFLQGCPLKCPWCANPESQEIKRQLMYNEMKCIKCGTCIKICPQKAISIDREGNALEFKQSLCIQCGRCSDACLNSAINFSGMEKDIDDIMKIVDKDRKYYEESRGGVTISGGEPFVQFNSLKEILIKCKERGYNTAVETTGDVPFKKIEEVYQYIDLFLYDVKHTKPEKIREVTGGNGNRILTNLKKLASINPQKIIVRVPVIPSFNYDDRIIEDIFKITYNNAIKEIHLLPYHTLGIDKYKQLGKIYEMKNSKMLSKNELHKYDFLQEKYQLKMIIGG